MSKKVPQYQAYAEAKAAVEADGNLQVEMSRFQDIKKRYDASKALQEFRPEVRQLRREMLLQSVPWIVILWSFPCAWPKWICKKFWLTFLKKLLVRCLTVFL